MALNLNLQHRRRSAWQPFHLRHDRLLREMFLQIRSWGFDRDGPTFPPVSEARWRLIGLARQSSLPGNTDGELPNLRRREGRL